MTDTRDDHTIDLDEYRRRRLAREARQAETKHRGGYDEPGHGMIPLTKRPKLRPVEDR